jgi:hypothetical protein
MDPGQARARLGSGVGSSSHASLADVEGGDGYVAKRYNPNGRSRGSSSSNQVRAIKLGTRTFTFVPSFMCVHWITGAPYDTSVVGDEAFWGRNRTWSFVLSSSTPRVPPIARRL